MIIHKTYKYKLYNNDSTKELGRIIDISAWIYNHCISLHRRYYRMYKKFLDRNKLQKHITSLKQLNTYEKWNDVPSQSIQNICDRIDLAYKAFYRNLKEGNKTSIPHFYKPSKYSSFTTKQAGYKVLEGNKIKIAKREYSYWNSRDIPKDSNIKRLTVKRTLRGYYIYLVVEEEVNIQKQVTSGKSVGFDFSMEKFFVSSDKTCIRMPKYLKLNLDKLSELSKKFDKLKGVRGSHKSLCKLYEKITNQRIDFHWKLAHKLTNQYDFMFFENLDFKSMFLECQQGINDFGVRTFLSILSYVSKSKGKIIHFVDKWFPSTQLCSECGFKNIELRDTKIKTWLCPNCGTHHNRDINAAINILREGTSSLNISTI